MICAKFERKILISYAGTSHLKFTHRGYKEEKFKILIWTFNTINFILKMISMMHWFQNCLQNQNPLHRTLEISKQLFSDFPLHGNFSRNRFDIVNMDQFKYLKIYCVYLTSTSNKYQFWRIWWILRYPPLALKYFPKKLKKRGK